MGAAVALWVVAVAGCRNAAAVGCCPDFSSEVGALLRAVAEGADPGTGGLSPDERSELQELYRPENAPLWLDAGCRPARSLRDALTLLAHAADDGLDPADYQNLLPPASPGLTGEALPAQDAARLDVAVSAGMLRYLRDVHLGRIDPRSIGFQLDTPRDQHDFAALLRRAIGDQTVLELVADLRPHLAQYARLGSLLRQYRACAADGMPVVPGPTTRAIHPGEAYGGTAVLARTLVALGDLPADAPAPLEPGRYEGAVVDGVRHLQVRHGLEPDGILGASTLAALRVPLDWRVRQVELTLERLRWLPHLGDQRLLVLNIPMFRLWGWDVIPADEEPRFGMDVIVGRALGTETPVLVAEMAEVVFRPYWNVPASILRREVLPRSERDPDYLAREDMEIVRGQGDGAPAVDVSPDALLELRQGALRVRQRPGPRNALGLVEFVFPNREDVYIHGTPAQALFARSRRDFSHGCVRVADPARLAEWVLQDHPEWTHDRIVAATTATQTTHVRLPNPIRVILFYTTAAAMPEDGTIHFAQDIYSHDARLDRALGELHRVRSAGSSPAPTK